jgi:hypothetical protein
MVVLLLLWWLLPQSSGRSQKDPTRSVASTGAEEALATHLDFFWVVVCLCFKGAWLVVA